MAFGLGVQFVGKVGKEGLQAAKKRFVIAYSQFLHELTDVEPLVVIGYRCIIRCQEIDKSVAYFIVRELQQIVFKLFVIALYREVSALVN